MKTSLINNRLFLTLALILMANVSGLFAQNQLHLPGGIDSIKTSPSIIGINTTQGIGAGDFIVKTKRKNGYGGMYVTADTDSLYTNRLPFYGYGIDDRAAAWHYYSSRDSSWKLNIRGTRMHVGSDGFFGFNTISRVGAADFVLNSARKTGYGGMAVNTNGTGRLPFYSYSINNQPRAWHYYNDTDKNWKLYNGGDRLTVSNTGFVGINTAKRVGAGDLVVKSARTTGYGGIHVTADGTNRLPFYGYATNGSPKVWHYLRDSDKTWRLYNSGDRLIVNSAGQVAIGTQFANGYRLSVDGRVICEEVRVELSQNWPDYVFADDYQLKDLNTLREEIEAQHHLPGIPSAKVVEAEGVELGEMQRKMMEKIEELTLYIIQLHDRIETLESEKTAE